MALLTDKSIGRTGTEILCPKSTMSDSDQGGFKKDSWGTYSAYPFKAWGSVEILLYPGWKYHTKIACKTYIIRAFNNDQSNLKEFRAVSDGLRSNNKAWQKRVFYVCS